MAIRQELGATGVLELVIDAPPVNAVGIADLAELARVVEGVAERPDVSVVLLRGEGRGFIGGGDVKEVQRLEGFEGILGQVTGSTDLTVGIHRCAVPVVAAVHRYCIGLGVLVAGVCDVVVTDEGCTFVLAEVDNGATGGAVQAMGLMPDKRLRQAMFTCEPVLGRELATYGTVVAVPDEAAVLTEARRLAEVMASKPATVLRAAKQAVNASAQRDIEELYRAETALTLELNMRGDARAARETFVSGERRGYLSPRD
ncbi:enoyl-CoA hydratase-related protein [Nocardioides humi]|uniref:Enoyl-CoA hydratase family protein n=1 Tax=Nocardioides humi TaxID=449461 RepID=A0ABN2AFZ2_9ACTN|nr:enoyl-CoA hydratase-related protein [Nocardioides humi]